MLSLGLFYIHIYCIISLYNSRTQPFKAFSNHGLHSHRLTVVRATTFHIVLPRHRGHSLWLSPIHLTLPLLDTGRRCGKFPSHFQVRNVCVVSLRYLLADSLLL